MTIFASNRSELGFPEPTEVRFKRLGLWYDSYSLILLYSGLATGGGGAVAVSAAPAAGAAAAVAQEAPKEEKKVINFCPLSNYFFRNCNLIT